MSAQKGETIVLRSACNVGAKCQERLARGGWGKASEVKRAGHTWGLGVVCHSKCVWWEASQKGVAGRAGKPSRPIHASDLPCTQWALWKDSREQRGKTGHAFKKDYSKNIVSVSKFIPKLQMILWEKTDVHNNNYIHNKAA